MTMACVNHPAVTVGLVRCRRCGQTFCRSCVVALRGQYYCARCKAEQVRDIQSGTEAGVLELASIGRRFGAQWVDGVLFTILVIPLFIVLGLFGAAATGRAEPGLGFNFLVMVLAAGIMFVYEGLMLSNRGQTLGKMAVGIKVVTPEGRDISAGQAWGRALTRQVFFSYFALVNYLPALFTKQKTAVHDLAAKTRVVRFRR
jgi:uncharacterized RDD family membrane protein YckC